MNHLSRLFETKKFTAAFLALTVFTTYLPVIHGQYLHTDDYFWSYWGGFPCGAVLHWIAPIGRPLAGLTYCTYPLVSKFSWMSGLRALSVLNLTVFAFLFFLWCRSWKLSALFSLSLAILVVCLPAFQVFASYLSTVPHGLSVTLGLVAAILSMRGKLWLSTIIFIAALSFNQAGALFLLGALSIPYLVTPASVLAKAWKDFFWKPAKTLILGMGIYYTVFRLSAALFNFRNVGKYDGRNFVTDFGARLRWFLAGPHYEVGNLWLVEPIRILFNLVLVLMVAWFIFELVKAKHWKLSLLKLFAVIGLLPLSYGISLVSSDPSQEYRTYAALGTVQLIIVLFALRGFFESFQTSHCLSWRSWLVTLLVVFAAYTANRNVYRFFVFPDTVEYRVVKDQIRHAIHERRPIRHIHVVVVSGPIANLYERHEVGEPTVRHTPNIEPLIYAALSELDVHDHPLVTTAQTSKDIVGTELIFTRDTIDLSFKTHPIIPGETLVIDMSKIRLL